MEEIPQSSRVSLLANLERVRDRMEAACSRCHRPPDGVRLVAVTKNAGPRVIGALLQSGQLDLGESRPELLEDKVRALGEPARQARWHMIGHYQRRKIRDTLSLFSFIHSIHSRQLMDALEARAEAVDHRATGLLQVNLSGESTKQGFQAHELEAILASATDHRVAIRGLMTMAPAAMNSDDRRALFSDLRELRDRLARPHLPLPELSMGMSGDFEEAILEGATLVRVGSALLEGVEPC